MSTQNFVPAPGTGGLYVPGGGGWTGALSNLFKNKLLLQFLGAAGQDFMSNSPGLATNAALQQNISSQNMMKLLSGMLSGQVPGAKMSVDEEGYSFKAPHPPKEDSTKGLANPFGSSQSGFSASDLAGVSPEMISQALQLKQTQDELQRRSAADVMDALYKGGMADYYSRMAGVAEAEVPATLQNAETAASKAANDWYNSLNKDERTAMEKEYDRAVSEGYKGKMADWKVLSADPETITLWKASIADGSFKGGLWQFIERRARAGAQTINLGPYERTMETGRAERQLAVRAPDFFSKVQGKLSSQSGWNYPSEAKDESEIPTIQARKVLNEMDSQIRQAFQGEGTITIDEKGWYLNGQLLVRNPYAGK